MSYWIFKTEPETFSIDDLARLKSTTWDGVRNYQVRNMIRDDIKIGDVVFVYHSNAGDQTGVVGITVVSSKAHPDMLAFDSKSDYYDPKSKKETPTWLAIDITFKSKAKQPLTLAQMKTNKKLEGLRILEKGTRLSITPVSAKHAEVINTAILS